MTTLGSFKADLRKLHGRGANFDAELNTYIRQAWQAIERRFSANYMRHFNEFTLNPEAQFPRTIKLDAYRIKSVDTVKVILPTGEVQVLSQVDPERAGPAYTGVPTKFWRVENNLIIINTIPAECYDVEIVWNEFTAVGTSDTWTHWLLQVFEDGLTYQTMLKIGARFRDANLLQLYAPLFEEAFTTLVMSEEEAEALTSTPVMGDYDAE